MHTANHSAHTDDVEWVQHYASVDTRKHLKTGFAGERYKHICSVDRHFVRIIDTNTIYSVSLFQCG